MFPIWRIYLDVFDVMLECSMSMSCLLNFFGGPSTAKHNEESLALFRDLDFFAQGRWSFMQMMTGQGAADMLSRNNGQLKVAKGFWM